MDTTLQQLIQELREEDAKGEEHVIEQELLDKGLQRLFRREEAREKWLISQLLLI